MGTSTIVLPAGFTASILDAASGIFTSFGGVVALIVGVLLAALVIDIIVGALRGR